MRERFNFVGRTTAQQEAEAAHTLAKLRKEQNAPHPKELPKTPEDLEAIDLADQLLKLEFRSLNIPEVPELRPERFHVMPGEWFEQNSSGKNGSHASFYDRTLLNRRQPRTSFFKTVLHEGIHAVSYSKFKLDVPAKAIDKYRLGYSVTVPGDQRRLDAFNEGVVEMTVVDLLQAGQKLIRKRLNLSESAFNEIELSYMTPRAVVESICRGLATYSGESPLACWEAIKRGQFTGEMMHLRAIEHAYGAGALRILDALELNPLDKDEKVRLARKERNEKVLAYFKSYDRESEASQIEKRWELALEIVGEEMFNKYFIGK